MKAPHARKMVFALRGDVMVHIQNVANGRACGCVCPGCGAPLEAVNNVTKKMAHFRHASGADCTTGYETALHLAGKEALLKLKRVALPEYRKTFTLMTSTGFPISEVLLVPSLMATADQAWEEVWQQGFRPDVVCQAGDHQLFIEIKVSHAVDAEKMVKIKRKGFSSIEIDLSRLEPEVLASQGAFDAFLTSSSESRTWLYSRKVSPLEAQAQAKLEKRLAAFEARLKKSVQARQTEHERRQRQLAEWAARKEQQIIAERQRLAPYLDQLADSRDADRVAAREQQLGQRHPVASLERYRKLGINDLFIRVEWHWAFKATFEQWQAFTLDLIFPADRHPPAEVLPHEIEKKVAAKFGVPEFIGQLRRHLAMHERKKVPFALTAIEMASIPQTTDAVHAYLKHLWSLGLLRRAERFLQSYYGPRGLGTYFVPRGSTIEEALSNYHLEEEKERQRAVLAQEKARKQKELDRLAQIEGQAATDVAVAVRILAIRATETYIFEMGKEGQRCTNCFMMSLPGMTKCPFCKLDEFLPRVRIDSDRIRINRYILASAPGVSSSLRSAPTLDLSMVQPYIARLAAEEAPSSDSLSGLD